MRGRYTARGGHRRLARWTGLARATAVGVCAVLFLDPVRVDAQSVGAIASTRNRDLARACWFDSKQADCVSFVRSNWYWIVAAVVTAVRVPSAPGNAPRPPGAMWTAPGDGTALASLVQIVPVGSDARAVAPTVWDGTFAHPNAPSFYTLRGLVSLDTSGDACAELPDELRGDRDLLQLVSCAAERELLVAGPDYWEEERAELQELRGRLAACLPPAAADANPCAAP